MKTMCLALVVWFFLPSSLPAQDCIDYENCVHWVGYAETFFYSDDVAISGEYAYVAAYAAGFYVLDITTPTEPLVVEQLSLDGTQIGVAVVGDYAYVAASLSYPTHEGVLYVLDVSIPDGVFVAGSVNVPNGAENVVVQGTYAYVAAGEAGLVVIDISAPASPVVVGSAATGYAYSVAVQGGYAYLADYYSGVVAIEVTDPANPTITGYLESPDIPYDVVVQGGYAYVPGFMSDEINHGALYIYDLQSPQSPQLVGGATIPMAATDLALSSTRAFLGTENYGVQVVDISEPTAPQFVGRYQLPGTTRGIGVSEPYAFVADQSKGIQVLDIGGQGVAELAGTAGGFDANEVAVEGSYAYVVDSDLGLTIVDISDAAAPETVGSLTTPGQAGDVTVSEGYAYVTDYGVGLQVIDVSDPTSPFIVGTGTTPIYGIHLQKSGPYAYIGTYSDLYVVDVSDPDNPLFLGQAAAPARDLAVVDDHVYAVGSNRLTVLDVSTPEQPVICDYEYLSGTGYDVAVADDYAYVAIDPAQGYRSLEVVSVANPYSLATVGNAEMPGSARGVAVDGDHVYLAMGDVGLWVLDVSEPSAPSMLGSVDTPQFAVSVVVGEEYVFVPDRESGVQIAHRQCDSSPSAVHDGGIVNTPNYELRAYPNPFNPQTTIAFDLPYEMAVSLGVYDVAGRLVDVLINDEVARQGRNEVLWRGRDCAGRPLPSGTYYYLLEAGEYTETKKMVLLK